MSVRPFSIRIFLPDGSYDGVRILEKSNWMGLGVIVPRAILLKARSRSELDRTGVYILIGEEPETERPVIYIGQGDPVRDRIESHAGKKDFWTWLVFFVTRDDSLNKAHIGYLESQLIRLARDANRATLDNKNQPQPSPLSEADAADMDGFLDEMLSILPVVGVSVFQKPATRPTDQKLFTVTGRGAKAMGYESTDGFVVCAGSTAVVVETESIHNYQSALRTRLKEESVLVPYGDFLRFSQDYPFSSPTTAAAVVLGRPASGPKEWKDEAGKSLRESQAE